MRGGQVGDSAGAAGFLNKKRLLELLRPYTVVAVRLAGVSPAPGLGNAPG